MQIQKIHIDKEVNMMIAIPIASQLKKPHFIVYNDISMHRSTKAIRMLIAKPEYICRNKSTLFKLSPEHLNWLMNVLNSSSYHFNNITTWQSILYFWNIYNVSNMTIDDSVIDFINAELDNQHISEKTYVSSKTQTPNYLTIF